MFQEYIVEKENLARNFCVKKDSQFVVIIFPLVHQIHFPCSLNSLSLFTLISLKDAIKRAYSSFSGDSRCTCFRPTVIRKIICVYMTSRSYVFVTNYYCHVPDVSSRTIKVSKVLKIIDNYC